MSPDMFAWDGTEAEFWQAVQRHTDGTFTEGDAAVLSEVVALARMYIEGYYQEIDE